MIGDPGIPPLRDLPPGRLDERREHLLAAVRAERRDRRLLPTARARRRRLLIALAAILVLGALVSTPALGLQNALRDLLGRSDVRFDDAASAPSVVRREFAHMDSGAPKGMSPNVLEGETRLAATLDVGTAKRRVWVAPTMTGGFCYLIERVSGGCHAAGSRGDPLQLDGAFVLRAGAAEPAMDLVAGKVFDPRATTLRVTFEDDETIALPFVYVSEPIDAGFFAYKPTHEQQRPGHRPATIVLLDAEGEPLAAKHIDWENEKRKAEQARKMRPPVSRSGQSG